MQERHAALEERAWNAGVHRLSTHEVSRKLLHIAPGFLPFLFVLARHQGYLYVHASLTFVLVTAGFTAVALWFSSAFVRPGERSFFPAVAGYAVTVLAPLLVFPDDLELGMTALVILAFGDAAASVAGMTLKGRNLPWNREKTIAGTTAFLACSLPAAVWTFWALSEPACSISTALFCGTASAVVAAVAESIPSSINDNIRVSVSAALTLLALRGLFDSWPWS